MQIASGVREDLYCRTHRVYFCDTREDAMQADCSRAGQVVRKSAQPQCQRAGACWALAAQLGRMGQPLWAAGALCGGCGGCCCCQIREAPAQRLACTWAALRRAAMWPRGMRWMYNRVPKPRRRRRCQRSRERNPPGFKGRCRRLLWRSRPHHFWTRALQLRQCCLLLRPRKVSCSSHRCHMHRERRKPVQHMCTIVQSLS